MRKIYKFCLFLMLLIFFGLGLLIVSANLPLLKESKPAPQEFIVDLANVISSEDAGKINEIIQASWKQAKMHIFVVTIRSLAEQNAALLSFDADSWAMFNRWGFPSKKHRNDILVVFSLEDRQLRVELGKYLKIRHSRNVENAIKEILPLLKQDRFSQGLLEFVNMLSKFGDTPKHIQDFQQALTVLLLITALIIGLTTLLCSLALHGKRGRAPYT